MSELAKKIAEATLSVGAFAADKRNRDQNYDYISADMVLEKGGQALARAGLAVIPSVDNVDVVTVDRSAGKSPRIDASVNFSMRITDGNDALIMQWFGMGSDYTSPDKAVYKAITSGHKYFLMKLLNISVGNEDGEHESEYPAQQPVQKAPVLSRTAEMIQADIQMTASREKPNAVMTDGKAGAMVGLLEGLFSDNQEANRHALTRYIFGVESTKGLTHAQKIALWRWMEPAQVGDVWTASDKARKEAAIIISAAKQAE